MSSAVTVAGLRKSYGEVAAVRGLSFTFEHGEIFALLGPNGAVTWPEARCLNVLAQRLSHRSVIFFQEPPDDDVAA